mgnify:CR=1 FL=1|tara:strand:+ start:121 stop:408 length:288 start_codon:yes stop_codon:yes gene_type:complete
MKIYTKIVFDKDNNLVEEKYFKYSGPIAFAGIHYDFKSTKGNKLMEKQAKREKKLAERKAKRLAKEGPKEEEVKPKALDPSKPISLDFLTNPNKE